MKWFTIDELCASPTALRKGIDNTPSGAVQANLTALVSNVLDPLREAWGAPIVVNSGYRCARLNKAVGGVSGSQHLTGCAADIRTVKNTAAENKKLFDLIVKLRLPFDQLIDEYGYRWVHVSHVRGANRRQVKRIHN